MAETQRDKRDAVTVGQIRKRLAAKLESELSTLNNLIRNDLDRNPIEKAASFLNGAIASTVAALARVDEMADMELRFPPEKPKS